MSELLQRHWFTFHSLVVLAGLATYIVFSRTLRQRRHPSAAIAWVISLVLIPYAALPLYLLLGNRKVVHAGLRKKAPQAAGEFERALPPVERLAAALGLPPVVSYEDLRLHSTGAEALGALREMLGAARRSIDLCTFIFGRDVLGDEVSALLMRRAREGVRVRLLIDGVGVYLGGRPDLKRLEQAGVQVQLFVTPWRSALRGRTNLRNHRKMLLVDESWLWCGGRNMAAEYFEGDGTSGVEPWLDLTFDLRGDLVRQACARFDLDWAFAAEERAATPRPIPANPLAQSAPERAQLIASGPDQLDDTVYTLLVSGCFTARSRILIVTPYFVPDPALLTALVLAARRGVVVDLLVPMHSNHMLADIARRAAMRDLAAVGARIWALPGMVHAKAVVIDEQLALAGSANIDERSLFLNYELMVAFHDAQAVARISAWIEQQMARATRREPRPPTLARELSEGLVRWLAFQL